MKRTVGTLLLTIPFVAAQSQRNGGLIARLGTDTVQVERFVREPQRLSGIVVQRMPTVAIVRWALVFDDAGKPVSYEAQTTNAAGAIVKTASSGTLRFTRDSIVRVGYRAGVAETSRIAATATAYPSPALPYLGVSYLMYELALRDARARAEAGAPDTSIYLLSLLPMQTAPQRTRSWLIGSDSAEVNYFGVAKSGYRFDSRGELLHADWTGTTYKYRVDRADHIDAEAVAAEWSVAERNGRGFGAASPRDSVASMVGSAAVSVVYSRPAARGRRIWGDLVPWNAVWRLGADVATHFSTSAALEIAGTRLPAGRYTLWMIPSESRPLLVVNRAVNIFGTMYQPAMDIARIPLERSLAGSFAERLTIGVDAGVLTIHWGDVIWRVPVSIAAVDTTER